MDANTIIASSTETTTTTTTTTINGLPASYVCVRNANGDYDVVKVLNVPELSDAPNSNAGPGQQEQEQQQQQEHFITQYRCGDNTLESRTINPLLYDEEQLEWFTDPELKIPEPMRLVMIETMRCYLCGDRQSNSSNSNSNSHDAIYHESAGEYAYGYRMCAECKIYFRKALFKTIAPIWRFRLLHESNRDNDEKNTHAPVWVARTRYDDNGIRVKSGSMPYKYSQWTIVRWVTTKYHDKTKAELDPTYSSENCVIVESFVEPLIKLVSVSDLFIINYGSIADPDYDPNIDDPMNRYSEEEKARLLADAISNAEFI